MLYLAQVTRTESLGNAGLRLLACQKSETTWALESGEEIVPCVEADSMSEGLLVLVDLSENGEVKSLCNALDWFLYLVRQYLTNGITPEFLQVQAERFEQWQQELTLNTQEVAQRALRVEARQEQIQQLEDNLRREQQELERAKQEFEREQQELERAKQEFEKENEI